MRKKLITILFSLLIAGAIFGMPVNVHAATSYDYKIKFNGNGAASGKMSTMKCDFDEEYTLPECKYVNPGYVFMGWNTKKNGKGTDYDDLEAVCNVTTKSGGSKTLYAVWKHYDYKITYNLNGGVNNSQNPIYYNSDDGTETFKEPTREGYKFLGWYSNSKLTKKITKIKAGSTGNKKVYAKWEANGYKVVFFGNGGICTDTTSLSVSIDETFRLPACAYRKGFRCVGWNTKADGSGKTYTQLKNVKNLTKKSGKTVNLYAKWEEFNDSTKALALPKKTGNMREDFIQAAASQLGYEENEKYENVYGAWMGHPTWPWCVYFASWCANRAGVPTYIIPKNGSTRYMRDFFYRQKRYYYVKGAINGASTSYMAGMSGVKTIDPSEIEAGDLILQETNYNVNQGADHTAIAIKYDEKQNMVFVVAGNTGAPLGAVKYYRVKLSDIHGVCKPNWPKK